MIKLKMSHSVFNYGKRMTPFRISLILISIGILSACSNNVKEQKEVERKVESSVVRVDSTPPVDVTIKLLAGFWKYSEVRSNPKESGTPPVGEILLGITEKNELTFATNGIEELKENLKMIPTNFEIRGNTLFPKDKLAVGDFKINFNNVKTTVFLLNENELILGKGVLEKETPVLYMYFTKKTRN